MFYAVFFYSATVIFDGDGKVIVHSFKINPNVVGGCLHGILEHVYENLF